MTTALKHLLAAASLAACALAGASPLTLHAGDVYEGLTASGTGTLAFSSDLLGALSIGEVDVAPEAPAQVDIGRDTDGSYLSVRATAPIDGLTIESTTGDVLDATTLGGALQTAPEVPIISAGGSLSVGDLEVDLVNRRVYVTLVGGNGVGTLSHFHLWNIGGVEGPTRVAGAGTYTTVISGLSITADGLATFSQALGLLPLGRGALSGVADFGTITSTIVATPAVPEASSLVMMTLGLGGMGLMLGRRARP